MSITQEIIRCESCAAHLFAVADFRYSAADWAEFDCPQCGDPAGRLICSGPVEVTVMRKGKKVAPTWEEVWGDLVETDSQG
jgi:hypothetical protein